MSYDTLKLAINAEGWRKFMARRDDPGFQPFMQKVLNRDRHTCQYCGFQAREYQEVVNRDQDYQNNKFSNLITCCCFCAQCLFLESVGLAGYGGGSLIYCPELSQNDLNSFCHVLFCAISNDTGYRSTAQSIYRSLKYRSQSVEKQFGEATSNPATLGQFYLDSGSANPALQERILKDLRLLPSRAKFRQQIERWAEAALQELATDF